MVIVNNLLHTGQLDGIIVDEQGRLRLRHETAGYVPMGAFLSDINRTEHPGPVRCRWIEQWTAPQQWRKHPGNPIYGPHLSGAWDSWTNGVSIIPTADGHYRMYYAGKAGEGIGFAEASIDDPLTWTEHPASPVLIPREDNWEGNTINQPRVVKVTETHWRMYYTGWGFEGLGTKWALGMAESFNGGLTWQRYQDDPIFPRGDEHSPDGAGACVPMVVRVGDRWMMWYTAGQLNPEGHQNIHLCHAFSDDGIHWEKYPGNPILTDDFSDGAARSVTSRCYVRHDDGVFRMWYSFAKPDYRILYAESLDGIHWERSPIAPVLDVSPAPAWDDTMVEYPEVQIVDGIFRLWFCGNGYGTVGYAEGIPQAAVAVYLRSGSNPTPDARWSGWVKVERDLVQPVEPYIQVKVELTSGNPLLSPALSALIVEDA